MLYPKEAGGAREKSSQYDYVGYNAPMSKKKFLLEKDLVRLAKQCRKKAGIRRAQAARDMGVSHVTIFNAEESPRQALTKLRMRMIAAYSPFRVVGPVFLLERQKPAS
jgi:DNA-binding XRE family transcriptional regulator